MTSILGNAYIRIRPDTAGFESDVSNRVGGAFKKAAGVAAAAFAAAGIGSFFKDTISLASDAEQSVGGVEAVFKSYAKTVLTQSNAADRALGLSANAYRELATRIGSQLKNAGVSLDELGGKTDGLISIGADFAAMYGGTTVDAVNAISSALKGEMDPIEKYGISLNDSALKAEAAALGLDVMGGSLTNAQKQQAVMSLLTKQGADAVGAFGRESETAAGRQQRATAQWENLRTEIGEKLLPAWSGLMDFVGTKVLPGLESAGAFLTDKVSPAIQGVYDLVVNGDFTGKLAEAFNIQEDNPVVGFVLDAREALLHAWDGLTGLWDGLDISGLGTRIKDAAIEAGGDLLAGFKTGMDTGDWKPLGETIVRIIGDALDGIVTLAGKLYQSFKTLMSKVDWVGVGLELGKQVPTLLAGLALGILNFDLGALLGGLADHWFEVLMGILAIAFLPAKWAANIAGWLGKIPFLGKLLEWGFNAVKGLADNIVGWAGDVISGFMKGLLPGGGRIVGWFKDTFETVRVALFTWGDDVLIWFRSLPQKFIQIAESLGSGVRTKFDEMAAWVGRILQDLWDNALRIIGGLRDGVVNIFTAMRDFIVNRIWTPFRDTLVSIAQNIWDWISQRFTSLKDAAVSIFTTARDTVVNVFTTWRDRVVTLAQNVWDWVSQRFSSLRDAAVTIFTNAKDRVVSVFTGLRDNVSQIAQNIWDWVSDKFTRLKDGVVGIFTTIRDTVGTIWDGIQDKVKSPIRLVFQWVNDKMIGPVNSILDKFPGGLKIPTLPALASGGLLRGPGTGTSDSILGVDPKTRVATAAVSNGEFVVRAAQTRKHLGLLRAINGGYGQFADGGLVGQYGVKGHGLGDLVGGALSGAADIAGDVYDKAKDVVSDVKNFATDMLEKGARKAAELVLKPLRDSALSIIPNKVPMTLLSGGINKLYDAVLSKGDEYDSMHKTLQGGTFAGVGGSTPNGAGGLGPMAAAARAFVQKTFGINNIGGYANRNIAGTGTKSDHALGKAIDVMIANYKSPGGIAQGNAVAKYFVDNPSAFGTKYVIWKSQINSGSGWKPYGHPGGGRSDTLQHEDHVHVSVFDKGGIARGLGYMPKATIKPERVLSPEQTKSFDRLAQGGFKAPAESPLVGELHLHVGENATVKEGIEETMFQLRRIKRGAGTK